MVINKMSYITWYEYGSHKMVRKPIINNRRQNSLRQVNIMLDSILGVREDKPKILTQSNIHGYVRRIDVERT